MAQKIDTSSYDKGKAFEDYIQNHIFTENQYKQKDRTPDFAQNSERFTESTLNPDFHFECIKNKQQFLLEAKFRTFFYTGDILKIFKEDQFNRFKEIDKPEKPILIAIGYEGQASSPNNISIIPFSKIQGLDIHKSLLEKYIIENKTLDNDKLSALTKDKRKIIFKIILPAILILIVLITALFKIFSAGTIPIKVETTAKVEIKQNINPVPLDKNINTPNKTELAKNISNTNIYPEEKQITVDMLNTFLVGDWLEKMGDKPLLIHIEEIDSNFVIKGYDKVGENTRPFVGIVEDNGNSNYTITLTEPGDDIKSDGRFTIEYIEASPTLNGVWTANIGKRNFKFSLTK